MADAEFVEDSHHVAFHGGFADEQRATDVWIGQSIRDTAEYLELSW
jgi:hypothetical protein